MPVYLGALRVARDSGTIATRILWSPRGFAACSRSKAESASALSVNSRGEPGGAAERRSKPALRLKARLQSNVRQG